MEPLSESDMLNLLSLSLWRWWYFGVWSGLDFCDRVFYLVQASLDLAILLPQRPQL